MIGGPSTGLSATEALFRAGDAGNPNTKVCIVSPRPGGRLTVVFQR